MRSSSRLSECAAQRDRRCDGDLSAVARSAEAEGGYNSVVKTEFADLSETKKSVAVEIPSDIVDAEIDRVARSYSRQARIPGFRQGKVPPTLIKKRFREQILHDVAHDLIPRAIDEVLRERGLEPVDTPDVKDVSLDEGQALTFTATFETLPPIDPGPLDTISLRRPAVTLEDNAVEQALSQLQNRAARFEPVEGRGVEDGDTVTLDVERAPTAAGEKPRTSSRRGRRDRRQGQPARVRRQPAGPRTGAPEELHHPLSGRLRRQGDGGHRASTTRSRSRTSASGFCRRWTTSSRRTSANSTRCRRCATAYRQDLQREAEAEADRTLRGDLLKSLPRA